MNYRELIEKKDIDGLRRALSQDRYDGAALSTALTNTLQKDLSEEIVRVILSVELNLERPTQIAAELGKTNLLKLFLEKKPDLDEVYFGETALLLASTHGHLEAVQLLLAAGANPNVSEDLKTRPLIEAVRAGDAAIVEALLGGGADPNAATSDRQLPLDLARKAGASQIAALLERAGGRAFGDDDLSAWDAAQMGRVDLLQKRLPQIPVEERAQALVGAAQKGQAAAIKLLLASGDLPKAKVSQALFQAAQEGFLEATKILIAAGADVNEETKYIGRTPLMQAAQAGHLEVIAALIEGGADINHANHDGDTAIGIAKESGRAEAVKALEAAGGQLVDPKKLRTQVLRKVSKLKRAAWLPGGGISGDSYFGGLPSLSGDCRRG